MSRCATLAPIVNNEEPERRWPEARTDIAQVLDGQLYDQHWNLRGRRCADPYSNSQPRAVRAAFPHDTETRRRNQ